jgi:ribosomal protein S18 acetylase RimI-like enzyme
MIKRELTDADVPEVTRIHLMAFREFFLSQLGESFLNLYYKCFLIDKNGFGIGIFDDEGNLMGFSVATAHSKGFNRNLVLSNILPFAVMGIQILFTRPKSLIRLFKNMSKNSSHGYDGNYAELFSIAVNPDKQGRGIGKLLLEDVEKSMFEKGCRCITLTTDFFNNADVINFYLNTGYTIFYDFVAYPDRRMYKMIKTLN